MDYQNMTAPCGLDCFNCTIYLANTNEKLREMVAIRAENDIDYAEHWKNRRANK